jgi:hypothetical protein
MVKYMKERQLTIVSVLAAVLLSGCASFESIYKHAESVNYSDGIDEREAKYIAQKYLFEKGIKDAFISHPQAEDNFLKPNQWEVKFQIKNLAQLDYYYLVIIDKKTGEIRYFGCEKKE